MRQHTSAYVSMLVRTQESPALNFWCRGSFEMMEEIHPSSHMEINTHGNQYGAQHSEPCSIFFLHTTTAAADEYKTFCGETSLVQGSHEIRYANNLESERKRQRHRRRHSSASSRRSSNGCCSGNGCLSRSRCSRCSSRRREQVVMTVITLSHWYLHHFTCTIHKFELDKQFRPSLQKSTDGCLQEISHQGKISCNPPSKHTPSPVLFPLPSSPYFSFWGGLSRVVYTRARIGKNW